MLRNEKEEHIVFQLISTKKKINQIIEENGITKYYLMELIRLSGLNSKAREDLQYQIELNSLDIEIIKNKYLDIIETGKKIKCLQKCLNKVERRSSKHDLKEIQKKELDQQKLLIIK